MKYQQAVDDVLNTPYSIEMVAAKHHIHKTTLARYVRSYINIQTVNDVVAWSKNPFVVDMRKIISPVSNHTKHIWDEILTRTAFLPKSASIRQRLYYIENNVTEAPACGCGKARGWNSTTDKGFNQFCGDSKCYYRNQQANSLRESTNMSNRGVAYPYLDPEVRSKRDATMLEKYGSTSYNKSRVSADALAVLGSKDKLQDIYDGHQSTFAVAKELGVSQSYVSRRMQDLGVQSTSASSFESQISAYIQDLGIDCGKNRNVISPKEIDIYVPSHKLGIECDGIYWHSNHYKSSTYHLDKTVECARAGIRLIHIFESEFISKPDIVLSRISSVLGKNARIYARKCEVVSVSYTEANDFYNAHHIQGGCKALSINYGLVADGDMVACMSFSKSRFSNKYEYELVRYSSRTFTNVVGGGSKLFSHFLKHHHANSVVSYSDNRWNSGKLYDTLGFTFSHVSPPNYHYFKNGYVDTLLSRVNFQKHKLASKLDTFDANLSEWENMKNNGYNRIWDCGNTVWVYGILVE